MSIRRTEYPRAQSAKESAPSHMPAAQAAIEKADQMVATLAAAYALSTDKALIATLRAASGISADGPLAIGQNGRWGWLLVTANGVEQRRTQPEGIQSLDAQALFSGSKMARDDLTAALRRTSAEVYALGVVRSLFDPGPPSRSDMEIALKWSPILEQEAYGAAAALSASLDELRPAAATAAGQRTTHLDSAAMRYWWQAMALANLTLIASDTLAQPWLVEMSDQFEWINWTPTFALVRERSVWLAVCAARSAIAFGWPVVSKYLRALDSARHPLKILDALFGLAAIGLSISGAAAPIANELKWRRQALSRGSVDPTYHMYSDALDALDGKFHADVLEWAGIKWRPKSPHGLATRNAMRRDPTRTYGGHVLGFAILRTALDTPIENFYPAARGPGPGQQFTARDASELLLRAWSMAEESTPPLH